MRYRPSNDSAFGFDPFNYYVEAHRRAESRVILESGRELVVRKLGLGKFLHFRWLGSELRSAPLERRTDILRDMLELCGVKTNELELVDLVVLLRECGGLNALEGSNAWLFYSSQQETQKDEGPLHYTGRFLSFVVHTLARFYGWGLNEILELAPEVALSHFQECLLEDRRGREWVHSLSDRTWEYDKSAKVSRYKPLPPLRWEQPGEERSYSPVSQAVIDRYYPKGVVVDLDDPGVLRERFGRRTSGVVTDETPRQDAALDHGNAESAD